MATPITFEPKVGEQFIKYARLLSARGYIHNTLGNMVIRVPHPDFKHGLAYTKHAEVSLEEIEIDNWGFKLYYQGSFVIFLLGSMVGVMSQYFGKPISCDFLGIDKNMAAEYCWIHGSSYIPKQYQKHMKCAVNMEGKEVMKNLFYKKV